MNTNDKPLRVTNNVVVSLDYELVVDGEVVDATADEEPITFLHGHGEIIPGLERALQGLSVGDSRHVVIGAEDAYGDVDPEAVMDIHRSEFPKDFPVEPGIELQVRDRSGETLTGTIVSVRGEKVIVDFNHPLAGKELHFSVTIADLRDATADEIAHGHVHDARSGDEIFEEDEDFDDEDFDEQDIDEDFDDDDDDFNDDDDDFDDDFDEDDLDDDDDFDDDYDDYDD